MSAYQKILAQFQKLGYYEQSSLQQFDINKALDTISSKNTGFRQFDRDIAEQLWDHTSKDSSRTVMLRNYINTIIQAQKILKQQVQITEQNIRRQNQPSIKKQLNQQLTNLYQDHRIISSPFGLPPLRQAQMILQSNLSSNPMKQSQRHGQSAIFAYESNTREQSSADLKIAFILAFFILAWELVLAFHKHHFFNMLVLFSVLCIYFLNYFDRNYIKFVLIMLGASLVLDLLWLIVMAGAYWNPTPETQHSTLHSGFLGFIVVMTAILMILKIVLLGLFFKYRDNAENMKKAVHLTGYKFKLDGRPTYNIFTPLLSGVFGGSQY